MGEEYMENLLLTSQFFCKSKIALKKKQYLFKKRKHLSLFDASECKFFRTVALFL